MSAVVKSDGKTEKKSAAEEKNVESSNISARAAKSSC